MFIRVVLCKPVANDWLQSSAASIQAIAVLCRLICSIILVKETPSRAGWVVISGQGGLVVLAKLVIVGRVRKYLIHETARQYSLRLIFGEGVRFLHSGVQDGVWRQNAVTQLPEQYSSGRRECDIGWSEIKHS